MKSTVSATPAVASPVAPGGNDGLLHAPTPIAPGLAPRPSIQSNQIYFPIVIILKATDQVVATGNVFIEKKFLRGLGSVGHIEDIAVDKTQQGKKLGLRLIQTLTDISEALGCYKTILDCSDENTRKSPSSGLHLNLAPLTSFPLLAFYEKCGFVRKGNEMVGVIWLRCVPVTHALYYIGQIRSWRTFENASASSTVILLLLCLFSDFFFHVHV
jgi:GNAT superfamily N-acetyltransferase